VKKPLLQSFLVSIFFIANYCYTVVSAQAETPAPLEEVTISLIPEYNRPAIRVIYEIRLLEELTFPQALTLYVPVDAQILSIANIDQGVQDMDLAIDVAQNGKLKKLHFLTNLPKIRIEYDDPNLIKQGNLRTAAFQWKSDHPVATLSVTVCQPMGASQIQMDPPLFTKVTVVDGFKYYLVDLGAVSAEDVVLLTLNYNKDISDPSNPALKVSAAAPITSATLGRTSSPTHVVIWLLAVAALVLIMIGAYYWWFRVNISNKYDRVLQDMGMKNAKNQILFCQECGNRSRPGDNYCSKCGTALTRTASTEPHPDG
jgi:ribosomal protein L37E